MGGLPAPPIQEVAKFMKKEVPARRYWLVLAENLPT
jgi:hypothetical protein